MIFLNTENEKPLIISETVRDRAISRKFLNILVTFPKNCFPAILVAILNFCVKRKNAFILETVRDRAISTKFLTPRVSATFFTPRLSEESTGDFPKNQFPAIFHSHLEFLHKTQKCIYLRNSVR